MLFFVLPWFFPPSIYQITNAWSYDNSCTHDNSIAKSVKTQQTTLNGKNIQEYAYYLLGFVPAHVIRLKENSWFCKLDRDQIVGVEDYMSHKEKF